MKQRVIAGTLAALVSLLAGCGPIFPQPKTSSPTPVAPSSSVAALGAWTATCSDATADTTALVANLFAQPEYAGGTPSAVQGFKDGVNRALAPLAGCEGRFILTVMNSVGAGSDAQAADVIKEQLVQLVKGKKLTLSSRGVGSYGFGSAKKSEVEAHLTLLLGKPSKTEQSTCRGRGTWISVQWGIFSAYFDANKPGNPLSAWILNDASSGRSHAPVPSAFTFDSPLPLWIKEETLRSQYPALAAKWTQTAPGEDSNYVEVVPNLFYVWENVVIGTPTENIIVVGGAPDIGWCSTN